MSSKIIVLAGVSGSGKTTVGQRLAAFSGLPFYDADAFHPPENIQKMASGQPLNDDDRAGWLAAMNHFLKENESKSLILACSALKEIYRIRLTEGLQTDIGWVFLTGSFEQIHARLAARRGHFMPPALLHSQFQIFEPPSYGLALDIGPSPERLAAQIALNFLKMQPDFGLVGLGVMGKSLARNLADKGIRLAVFNREVAGLEEKVAQKFIETHPETHAIGFQDLSEFVHSLAQPRKIMLMIPENATSSFLEELLPLLAPNDLIIDGGNAHFEETERRAVRARAFGVSWLGAGVSGGEAGALRGPAIMVGGEKQAFSSVRLFLEKIAAKDFKGRPCCARVGEGGAGHFVKMIHNGIEYAEMQLLTEIYSILRDVFKMSANDMAALLTSWRDEKTDGFLLEITVEILRKTENGQPLLDLIEDQASNKGTGSWATEIAARLGSPASMIAAALFARFVSSMKTERVAASKMFEKNASPLVKINLADLKKAYATARLVNHHQGFALLAAASERFGWQLDLAEIARIWTSGCIIRSKLMQELTVVLRKNEPILLHPRLMRRVAVGQKSLSKICQLSHRAAVAVPCFSAAHDFLNGYSTARSGANLIQAQRDFFGAHTVRRTDDPTGKSHHFDWTNG